MQFMYKNDDYEHLESLSPLEKGLEASSMREPYLIHDFKGLIYSGQHKRQFQYRYDYKEEAVSILTKRKFNKLSNRQLDAPIGKRTIEQFIALSSIKKDEAIWKKDENITSVFPVEELSDYPIKKSIDKAYDTSEFISSLEKKDLIHFFVTNFGFDFRSRHFRKRKENFADEEGWKEFSDGINYGRLVNHLTDQYILQAKQFSNSKIVKVEFDQRKDILNMRYFLDGSGMLKILAHEFGSKPFLVERSLSGDEVLRAYFEFDSYIPDEYKKKLESYFCSSYGFRCRIQKTTDYMSLPFSKEVLLYGSYDESHILCIKPESLEEIHTRLIHEKPRPSSIRSIENLTGKIRYGKIIEVSREEFDDLEDLSSSLYQFNEGYKKFSYSAGTRYENQRKLAVWCCGHGLDFIEYKNLAYELNHGSKDMKNWSERRIHNTLLTYYRFAESVAQPSKPKGSSTWYLQDDGVKRYSIQDQSYTTFLDTSSNKDKFLAILNQHYTETCTTERQQGKWKTYFLNDGLKLYKFLLRKSIYDRMIGKKYKDERFSNLNKGIILPTAMYKDTKLYLQLHTDIARLMKAFLELGLVTVLTVEDREYSYKNQTFSKHYQLIDDNQLNVKYCKVMNYNSGSSIYNYKSIKPSNRNNKNSLSNSFHDPSLACINYVSYFHFSKVEDLKKLSKKKKKKEQIAFKP